MDKTIPLGSTDKFLLKLESPETPAHTASLSTFHLPPDAKPDFLQELTRMLVAQAAIAAPFNYRLSNRKVKTWTVLDPDDIDLDYHVRHSALPYPGGERELGTLISRLHALPLDFNRPLWEFHLIEGLHGNRFATYMKMHHALADGGAVIGILAESLSRNANCRPTAPWARPVRETPAKESPKTQTNPPRTSGVSLGSALMKVVKTSRSRPATGFVGPFVAPQSVFNTRIAAARRYSTQQLSLPRLKAIGKREGVSVNDVFLASVASALRRYLLEIGELPERPLVAAVPAATLRDMDDGLGNAVSVIYTSLATHVADPLERLHIIEESMRAGKQFISELKPGQISVLNAVSLLPAALLNSMSGGAPSRPITNVTISNVPGPKDTLWFGEAQCEALYPCSMIVQAQALNITARGYCDKINVGIVGARDLLPSVQRLSIYTGEAVGEMEQLLGLELPINPPGQG